MNILLRLLSKKIEINTKDNITIIDIKEELSLEEYTKILKRSLYKDLLNIISLKYLLESNSLNISPKRILLINQDNLTIIITIQNNSYTISRLTKKDKLLEESFQVNITTKNYRINKSIHELDGNTKEVKSFNKDESKNIQFMYIPKKEALSIVASILATLSKIPSIKTYLKHDFNELFNIVPDNEYYPVISNETITLSWPRRYGQTNINTKSRTTLDIILNSTREKVGEITFNYHNNIKNNYTGNVGYHITKEFQHNGYATQALALLKKLLRNNTYPGNKDLFLSISPENIYSEKVALNNEGELYYEGKVPENDPLSRHSGITKVKIYRIKL